MKVYWNGKIMDEKSVAVSPWDLGFLRGYGVFDYIAVYGGKAFELDSHIERLHNSAQIINLSVPVTREFLSYIVHQLIKENDIDRGVIRIVLTGGVSSTGILKESEPSLLIRPEVSNPLSPLLYKKGGALITREYVREFPQAKTTQYIEAVKHENDMREAGAVEVLYFKDKQISECSRSNVFIVSGGTVFTPNKNILFGITRQLVLELAEEISVQREERDISVSELMNADEVFITGTGKKIVPIVAIDGVKIGNGSPGAITQKLMSAYDARTRK